MAEDVILEDISEETERGKKNLMGESWGYETDFPMILWGSQVSNYVYFENRVPELVAKVTYLACDIDRTKPQIIDFHDQHSIYTASFFI